MLPPDDYDIAATAERLRFLFADRHLSLDQTFDLEDWKECNARTGHAGRIARIVEELDCGRGSFSSIADTQPWTVLDYLSEQYAFDGGPDEVRAYLDGTFPLSIEDAVKFAAFLGCQVREFSPYHQRRIDAVAEFSALEEELERVNETLAKTEGHLKAIAGALPRMLKVGQEPILQRIIANVHHELADAPAPEEIEGFASALDYMGLLKAEGSDNGLYQLGMDMLDMALRQQLDALPPADQVAVLLPLCGRSRHVDLAEDLVASLDVNVDEWAAVLRTSLWEGWREHLQNAVLATIPSRSRHA